MKIALDATYSTGRNLSGVGIYSRELMAALAETHPEARFRWCYRPHRLLRALGEPCPPNVRRRPLGDWFTLPADVFHGLNQRLPARRPPARAVCTFHDLFVLTGDYSTDEFRARFAAQARHAAEHAERIIAVSEFTARQVEELLGYPGERIRVVPHGVRPLPAPPGTVRETVVLHVGAVQKRKNIARLVEAFERVGAGWRLVLAGSAGYDAAGILARIERSPARERIAVTGYLTEGELAAWYARAAVFAFPSLDEGFGMPVLEAMAAGAAVVASSRAAVPEVAGDAALLVDPEDSDALAAALQRLIGDEQLRCELVRKGRNRAAEFTWERAAAATWSVYAELAR